MPTSSSTSTLAHPKTLAAACGSSSSIAFSPAASHPVCALVLSGSCRRVVSGWPPWSQPRPNSAPPCRRSSSASPSSTRSRPPSPATRSPPSFLAGCLVRRYEAVAASARGDPQHLKFIG